MPVRLEVELRLDADFADLFEVKLRRSRRPASRTALRAFPEEGRLELRPVDADRRRGVEIRLSCRPEELSKSGARFSVSLAPGATRHTCLDVYVEANGVRPQPRCRCDAFGTLTDPLAERARAPGRAPPFTRPSRPGAIVRIER